MLLRHQVLLTDWQTEHLKLIAKHNDLSFSEMIRIILCEGLMHSASVIHPEYKSKISKEKLEKITREGTNPDTENSKKHKLISDLYFETRKTTDYINDKIKQLDKKITP